ncbi:MAG: glycosyltransferase family 4 protein [Thermoclostridium sp.]|nr:glycosyltransferase family 4 protein [Thermoclostridium sp.]
MTMKVFELATVDLTLYKFVLPLMKELRQNGFNVLCGAEDHGYLEKIDAEGFVTYAVPFRRSLNPLALVRSFLFLVRVFKRERVDILHTHTPIASVVGRIAAVCSGVKVKIYTVHGFIIRPKIYEYLEKFMAKAFTSFIFTVNQEDYTYAVSNQFIAPDKIININSVGVDVHHFDPGRISKGNIKAVKESLKLQDVPIIGYVGRIVRSKGILDLVRAFIEVRKTIFCKLLLVGPWDLNERSKDAVIAEIQILLKKHQLEEDVIFAGHREDIAEVLSVMDIFVLPSYREGMPVALLEAMALEKTVVGTNIRGVKEEIAEDCGFLYEAGDIEALAVILKNCLSSLKAFNVMAKRARHRVITHFSQEQALDKQIQVFLEYQRAFAKKE